MTGLPEVREQAMAFLPYIVALPLVSVWAFVFDGIYFGATRTAELRNGMAAALALFALTAAVLVPGLGQSRPVADLPDLPGRPGGDPGPDLPAGRARRAVRAGLTAERGDQQARAVAGRARPRPRSACPGVRDVRLRERNSGSQKLNTVP